MFFWRAILTVEKLIIMPLKGYPLLEQTKTTRLLASPVSPGMKETQSINLFGFCSGA